MEDFAILTYLIFIPLITSVVISCYSFCIKNKELESSIMRISYISLGVEMVLGVVLFFEFDPSIVDYQFQEKYIWFKSWNVYYSVGIDSFSIYFILLTVFLIPPCIFIGLRSIKKNKLFFVGLFLALQGLVVGVFCAKDMILFYVFFEAFLIPMYLIIGIWGGNNRVYASIKFFIYTLFGSVLMLIAIAYIFVNEVSNDISELSRYLRYYPFNTQMLLWLAFFVAFAIKIPLWPFHTWLPDAHVQAPTSGSVILAGVLLKIGGYGLIRFNLPMFPEISIYFADYVIYMGIIAIIYTSIVALMQTDMKKMIAYSSVAHMGYVVIGIFSFNKYGIEGAVFQMISHGLISSALFLCIGVLYEQTTSKEISLYQGLATRMPNFSLLFTIFVMGSIALPGTSGFIGEFFVLLGVFHENYTFGILASLGIILGAIYMLWLYIRIIFGDHSKTFMVLQDICVLDKYVLGILGILVVLLGIYPSIITNSLSKSAAHLISSMNFLNDNGLNKYY